MRPSEMLASPLPWTAHAFAILDTETTGPDPSTAIPVELAVARFEGGELVGSWSTLLNPGCPIPSETTAIHGITDTMVAAAPLAQRLFDVLPVDLLDGAYPCGYNALHYDQPILRRLMGEGDDDVWDEHAVDFPWLVPGWLDPLVYVRDIDGLVKGEKGRHKLGAACERRKIEHRRAHRAFGDCEATGRLLWAMRDEINRTGELTLGQLVKRTVARARVQEESLARYWGRGKVHGGRDVA